MGVDILHLEHQGSPGILEHFKRRPTIFVLFIASTRTSTIPGISIAGPTPEATLYTPALDAEYLLAGRPLSLDVLPVTPDGIPTPALVSRAVLGLLRIPALIVDAGSYIEPAVPHARLPSRVVGERIDRGRALPRGRSRRLYEEAKLLGQSLSHGHNVVVGESMPGGTTTAMAIMETLGYRARGRVSGAGPVNPHGLKLKVYEEGLRASGLRVPANDVFEAVDSLGDPLHVSIAGFVAGALEAGSAVMLGGGTQMCSVLAILRRLGVDLEGKVILATTRWLAEDKSSDIMGLVKEVQPSVPVAVADLDFGKAPYRGLRMYEEGYVKEGVGMGGLLALAAVKGLSRDSLLEAIYREYERVMGS